jgi:hypothetical protein
MQFAIVISMHFDINFNGFYGTMILYGAGGFIAERR